MHIRYLTYLSAVGSAFADTIHMLLGLTAPVRKFATMPPSKIHQVQQITGHSINHRDHRLQKALMIMY